ncbi:MAG: epoxyqueuosine reductase, partial [Henriciella sp.]
MADDLAAWLDTEARRLGFDVVGLARADETWAASERLEAFVEAGYHGSMTWMQETLERRKMPTSMWPEAKSAIVVGMNYGPDIDPLAVLDRPDLAGVSVYAKGSDYHDVLKKRLKQLA